MAPHPFKLRKLTAHSYQTSLRSVLFDPGKYSKNHRSSDQTAADGF